jgi:hypothetical protein
MDVKIKNLDAEMQLKAKGMELDVKAPNGKVAGTLAVKKAGLVWTKGKAKGVNISWVKFLAFVDGLNAPKPAAKKKATKKVAKKKAAPKKAVAKKPAAKKTAVKKTATKKKATKKATKATPTPAS